MSKERKKEQLTKSLHNEERYKNWRCLVLLKEVQI